MKTMKKVVIILLLILSMVLFTGCPVPLSLYGGKYNFFDQLFSQWISEDGNVIVNTFGPNGGAEMVMINGDQEMVYRLDSLYNDLYTCDDNYQDIVSWRARYYEERARLTVLESKIETLKEGDVVTVYKVDDTTGSLTNPNKYGIFGKLIQGAKKTPMDYQGSKWVSEDGKFEFYVEYSMGLGTYTSDEGVVTDIAIILREFLNNEIFYVIDYDKESDKESQDIQTYVHYGTGDGHKYGNVILEKYEILKTNKSECTINVLRSDIYNGDEKITFVRVDGE